MPVISGDFSKISSEFQPLDDGDYLFMIEDVIEGKTRNSQLPQIEIKMKCVDPQHPDKEGYPLTDFITLETKKGGANRVGLGQLKAYFEATVGEEAANNPSGLDTDELKGSTVRLILKKRSYKPEGGEERFVNDVSKVLSA